MRGERKIYEAQAEVIGRVLGYFAASISTPGLPNPDNAALAGGCGLNH